MTAKYPRRLIALGPPFDDGTYWTPDGVRHSLPLPTTGPEFVAEVVARNKVTAAGHRARMDRLDSKGRRIGWRAFNGANQGRASK